MPSNPPSDSSIFQDGKIIPGIYKIRNLYSQTYLDIHEHSRRMCCRPAENLDGMGLWEIKPLGAGYSIRRVSTSKFNAIDVIFKSYADRHGGQVEEGKPDQFCTPMEGFQNRNSISVDVYPAAWRIEVVNDIKHRGFEYVRVFWGNTMSVWYLDCNSGKNGGNDGANVQFWVNNESHTEKIWKFFPVKTDASSTPPPEADDSPLYEEGPTGQSSTRTKHAESEKDEFGTIVTEVTVVTTKSTVTTRKKYRVGDP